MVQSVEEIRRANYILRLGAVSKQTGLSRSTIYSHMQKGQFPKPILLGSKSVGWLGFEIDAWIERQILATRGGNSHD